MLTCSRRCIILDVLPQKCWGGSVVYASHKVSWVAVRGAPCEAVVSQVAIPSDVFTMTMDAPLLALLSKIGTTVLVIFLLVLALKPQGVDVFTRSVSMDRWGLLGWKHS